MKRIYLLIIVLCVALIAKAQKVNVGGLKYYLFQDVHEAVIDNGNMWTGELNIPSVICYNGETYVVKGISWQAFCNSTGLTKVRIPKTVDYVVHHVLSDETEICGTVSSDYMNPFIGCTALQSIEVDEENVGFKAVDGVLFSKDGTGLYCCPAGIMMANYFVPQGVSWIGADAFANSVNLTDIRMSKTVTRICSDAFAECHQLEQIRLSENLTKIEPGLLRNCSKLWRIDIPDNVRSIGEQAFSGCTSFSRVDIPENIQSIGALAFSGCTLTALIIWGKLDEQSVNQNLFEGLNKTSKVYVQAAEVERYKGLFAGKFYSIEGYLTSGIRNAYYRYCIVTPDGHCRPMRLSVQSQKEVTLNGKDYVPFRGYIGNDDRVDNMVLLRQDGMKFYRYDTKTETEHLIFDFGLQKNDSFKDCFSATEYEVKDVRDTIVYDEKQRLIELQGKDDASKHDIWMEGVGSIYTGILHNNDYCKDAYLIVCDDYYFYTNNQNIKSADMDVTVLEWDGDLETDEDFEEYRAWLYAPSDLNAEFIGDTLHVWGRLNVPCMMHAFATCIIDNNAITFNYYSSADMDCLSCYEIETRFPGFQQGKYSVSLLNKVVELDNTESIYTSVDKASFNHGAQNARTYDLQGRPVPSKPKRGLYIQGGRIKARK